VPARFLRPHNVIEGTALSLTPEQSAGLLRAASLLLGLSSPARCSLAFSIAGINASAHVAHELGSVEPVIVPQRLSARRPVRAVMRWRFGIPRQQPEQHVVRIIL
jgi:hypothetical protein